MSALADRQDICSHEKDKRKYAAEHYNKRHRARDLPEVKPGQQVCVWDQIASGVVLRQVAPRS